MGYIFGDYGISFKDVKIDVEVMIGCKDKIVKQFIGGIGMLFKVNKVVVYYGFGQLQLGNVVKVKQYDGLEVELKGINVIIVVGLDLIELLFVKFDGEIIVDNVGGLDFIEVLNCLVVIGVGVIGLELGSVWKCLGVEVIIFEVMLEFLVVVDVEVVKVVVKEFKKQGLDIKFNVKVFKIEIIGKGKKKEVIVIYIDVEGEKILIVDKLLVVVGCCVVIKGLLVEGIGVKVNECGQIEVDVYCYIGVNGVWVVGDCVCGLMLVYKGFEEGIVVVELIVGLLGYVNFDIIFWVIYIELELVWVGKIEVQLKVEGILYKVGSFLFVVNGCVVVMIELVGFVKILVYVEIDCIFGMYLVGVNVFELVYEGVLIMEFSGLVDDLVCICYVYLLLLEVIYDVVMVVSKCVIYKVN